MAISDADPGNGLFYGWLIVGARFLAFETVHGSVTNSVSVFVNPIVKFIDTATKVRFTLTNIGTGMLDIYADSRHALPK
jgi:hypothetical protein